MNNFGEKVCVINKLGADTTQTCSLLQMDKNGKWKKVTDKKNSSHIVLPQNLIGHVLQMDKNGQWKTINNEKDTSRVMLHQNADGKLTFTNCKIDNMKLCQSSTEKIGFTGCEIDTMFIKK